MNKTAELAEQYIRESELHLAHIDVLIARAGQAAVEDDSAAETQALIGRMQRDRDRLARELDALRRLPPEHGSDVVSEGEKLKGVLATVGLQFEKVLGSVLEHGKRKGSAAQ